MTPETLIQKFITGTITEVEQKQFQNILREQPSLIEDLKIEQSMYDYRNGELKSQLKKAIPPKSKGYNKISKWIALLFSLLALGAIAYFGYKDATKEENLMQYADRQLNIKNVSPVQLMGENNSDKDKWTEAVNAYNLSDYKRALAMINKIEKPNSEQQLYKGLCYIYKVDPDLTAAEEIMDFLQQSQENLVYDQALWFGALLDIKMNKIEDAKSQLSIIIDQHLWRNIEAKKLQKRIKTVPQQ